MNTRQKNKLSTLLKRIGDDSSSDNLVIDEILREIENVKSSIPKEPNLSPFYSNIDELRGRYSSLASTISSISNRITDSSNELILKIKESNDNSSKALIETLGSLSLIQEEVKQLSKEIRKSKGGGSIPLQVSLNGIVANTKYSDVNIINVGASFSANNTTHKTDLTIVGGGGGGSYTWYQDERPSYTDGIHFTLAHTPVVLSLYVNGQLQVNGVNYTLSGANITMGSAIYQSDIISATYASVIASGTWYQDEQLSFSDGVHYTLAHTPSNVVFIYSNGQELVSGVNYNRSGTAITLTFTAYQSDLITATYS